MGVSIGHFQQVALNSLAWLINRAEGVVNATRGKSQPDANRCTMELFVTIYTGVFGAVVEGNRLISGAR